MEYNRKTETNKNTVIWFLTNLPKNIFWRKDNILNKWYWGNCVSICRRMKLDPYLLLFLIVNLKWTKDLGIRPETLEVL